MEKIDGTWPENCLQRAFVAGAKWWQFYGGGATAFPYEVDQMEQEAIKRYGEPKDVDALLADVRALVEATKGWHSVNDCMVEGRTDCELCKAIAAVEARLKEVNGGKDNI